MRRGGVANFQKSPKNSLFKKIKKIRKNIKRCCNRDNSLGPGFSLAQCLCQILTAITSLETSLGDPTMLLPRLLGSPKSPRARPKLVALERFAPTKHPMR